MRPLVFALGLVTVLAAAPVARACRCTGPTPGSRALAQADVAAVGEVVRVFEEDGLARRFVLRVDQRFRGPEAETIEVSMPGTNCAFYSMREGQEWLIFAREVDGVLTTRKCTGSNMLRQPGEERSRRAERWVRQTERASRRYR